MLAVGVGPAVLIMKQLLSAWFKVWAQLTLAGRADVRTA